MGWVRSRIRFGVRLALLALAVQVVVSFGHVHLHNFGVAAQAAAVHTTMGQPSHRVPAQAPADDDDYCPICASIFLASTSLAAVPPVLLVPTAYARIDHSVAVIGAGITPQRF